MATHKSLKVTYWTRTVDLIKGILLYGSVNWRRASDGLRPPRLSPHERKHAMPAPNPELVRPRANPQNAIIKAQPKTVAPKKLDITAGAIVSDPLLPTDGGLAQPFPKRHLSSTHEEETVEMALPQEPIPAASDEEVVVVRRRKRHGHHASAGKHISRSSVRYIGGEKPGLLARWFGMK